jgi:hypothetical protein
LKQEVIKTEDNLGEMSVFANGARLELQQARELLEEINERAKCHGIECPVCHWTSKGHGTVCKLAAFLNPEETNDD